ncbi:MAG: PilZ domain-containing protein, partial [Thermoanaerobaculia bacterium]
MSRSLSNRRRYPRYDVAGVAGSFVVPTAVQVVNLSLGGMALETSRYLDFGRDYRMRINDGRNSFSLTGRVVWCCLGRTVKAKGDDVLPVYRAGFQFQAISEQRLKELWDFIRQNSTAPLEDTT